jgi:hypothetical protein
MKAGSFLGLQGGLEAADKDSVRFHISWKGTIRYALKLVKIPPEWTQGLTGNAAILWEAYEDYKRCEGLSVSGDHLGASDAPAAQHRFDILSKVIPAAIIIYYQDSAYREVADRMIWYLIQNRDRFKIPPHHLDPDCWYHDAKDGEPAGRLTPGVIIPKDEIVSADDNALVLKGKLPPKKYFASIEGIDHWVSINSNKPFAYGAGWGYRIYEVYGPEKEMVRKTLIGD